MVKTDLTNENPKEVGTKKVRDPEEIVFELYKAYEPLIDPHLWPWETERWYELVFCLLNTIAEPEISSEITREVTRTLSKWHLLDLEILGELNPANNDKDASHPTLVTIARFLQQSGFDENKVSMAVIAICEAASEFKQKYEGKVQKCFRKYGILMLNELVQNISFSQLNSADAKRAFAIWLQNVLNLPIPASDPVVNDACDQLGYEYETLLEVVDRLDINLALLDDALRFQMEVKTEEVSSVT